MASMCLLGATYFQRKNGSDLQTITLQQSPSSLKHQFINSLIQTGPVQYVWGNWWCLILQKTQMTESLIYLLLQAIHKKSFIQDSITFGQTWIEKCLVQPKVIDSSLVLVDKTFLKDKDVQAKAVDLCCWFVNQEEVITMAGNAFANVCNRDDTYDIEMWQLS